MQFNVASLLKESTGATREFAVDDDVRIDGVKRRVIGDVRLDRTPRGILVRATVAGETSGECSRCLKPLTYPMEIEFDEEFIPTIDVNTGHHVDAPEDGPDAYRITPRHVIDLTEAITQYWAIALPLAPVCDEDCPGLCTECGADLSSGSHDCVPAPVDSPWAKLADLRL